MNNIYIFLLEVLFIIAFNALRYAELSDYVHIYGLRDYWRLTNTKMINILIVFIMLLFAFFSWINGMIVYH